MRCDDLLSAKHSSNSDGAERMEAGHMSANGPEARVLIVDDHDKNLTALEAILAAPDRVVVKARSGEEALTYLLEDDYSVVLLDIKLSGMDGYETASLIRAHARIRDVPIIFLTSYSKQDADVVRGYSYGAVDYIFKPIVQEILLAKVKVFVELYKKTEDLKRKNQELERAQNELMRTKAAESLIQHAPDPIFLLALDGTICQANVAASELLGLQADEVVEQSVSRFLGPDETKVLVEVLREVAKRGMTRNVKLNPKNIKGEVIPTTLNASALRDSEGSVVGVIGILRDMRAYEQVLQDLEKSKSQLIEKIMDLEKFEEVVVGRELRMIELEKELKRLKGELRNP